MLQGYTCLSLYHNQQLTAFKLQTSHHGLNFVLNINIVPLSAWHHNFNISNCILWEMCSCEQCLDFSRIPLRCVCYDIPTFNYSRYCLYSLRNQIQNFNNFSLILVPCAGSYTGVTMCEHSSSNYTKGSSTRSMN